MCVWKVVVVVLTVAAVGGGSFIVCGEQPAAPGGGGVPGGADEKLHVRVFRLTRCDPNEVQQALQSLLEQPADPFGGMPMPGGPAGSGGFGPGGFGPGGGQFGGPLPGQPGFVGGVFPGAPVWRISAPPEFARMRTGKVAAAITAHFAA